MPRARWRANRGNKNGVATAAIKEINDRTRERFYVTKFQLQIADRTVIYCRVCEDVYADIKFDSLIHVKRNRIGIGSPCCASRTCKLKVQEMN